MTTASIATAGIYPCKNLDSHGDELLQKLYFYSLFVQAAGIGEFPSWGCEVSDEQSSSTLQQQWEENRHGEYFKVKHLSNDDLKEYGWYEIANSFREEGLHIGVYKQEGSDLINMVCEKRSRRIKLFLTWSKVQTNINERGFFSKVITPFVRIIDFEERASPKEGLNAITYERDDNLSNGKEKQFPATITAIPGTDFTKLREVGTSFNDLRENSCLFEFMAAIADKLLSKAEGPDNLLSEVKGPHAFAGHSLGGSVTQYVAQKLALASEMKTRFSFQAYAFNAIGLDESRGGNPSNLYSFYIKGDPVVYIGDEMGRFQGGNIVQYTPPVQKGFIGPIKESWHKIIFKWHRLPGVQEGLCLCMNQNGTLKITK